MVGLEVALVFNKEFRITEVRGLDEAVARLAKNPPLGGMVVGLMSTENMKQLGEQFFGTLPGRETAARRGPGSAPTP